LTYKKKLIEVALPLEAINAASAREKELKNTSGRSWIKQAIAEGRARQTGGEPFEEKMMRLTSELSEQFAESRRLEDEIRKYLKELGFDV